MNTIRINNHFRILQRKLVKLVCTFVGARGVKSKMKFLSINYLDHYLLNSLIIPQHELSWKQCLCGGGRGCDQEGPQDQSVPLV